MPTPAESCGRCPANAAQLGLRYAQLDRRRCALLHAPAGLYRGLTPTALACCSSSPRGSARSPTAQAPLVVTGAVSDTRYQRLLGTPDPPAAAGWSFTLARTYAGRRQANALQAMLDRLQALNLIAWARYPGDDRGDRGLRCRPRDRPRAL